MLGRYDYYKVGMSLWTQYDSKEPKRYEEDTRVQSGSGKSVLNMLFSVSRALARTIIFGLSYELRCTLKSNLTPPNQAGVMNIGNVIRPERKARVFLLERRLVIVQLLSVWNVRAGLFEGRCCSRGSKKNLPARKSAGVSRGVSKDALTR